MFVVIQQKFVYIYILYKQETGNTIVISELERLEKPTNIPRNQRDKAQNLKCGAQQHITLPHWYN